MVCVYRIKGDSRIFNSKEELYSYLKDNYANGIKFNGIVPENKTENGRPVFAWYDETTKSISISPEWVKKYNEDRSQGKIESTLLVIHEILHALKGTRTVEQQKELDAKLTEFRKSILTTPEYKALKEKENKTEQDNKILAILNMQGKQIDELLTYGLTDLDFAKFLDTIKTEVNGETTTFWKELVKIIKELVKSFGQVSKLDELNYIFDKFISGEELDMLEMKRADQIKDLGRDIIDETFEELGGDGEIKHSSFDSIIEYDIKASSFSSSINQEVTNSPFSKEENDNIMNVLSQYAITTLDTKYRGKKLIDISVDAIKIDILKGLVNDIIARRKNNQITPKQNDLLVKVVTLLKSGDPDFWKMFRIKLSNKYGYDINDIEEFKNDVEYLDKSWDQSDVYTKHPMNTVNDRIKHLINTTFEVDPITAKILEDGNIVYQSNTNTPTGFANTLSFTDRANKLYDLMQGALTKEDMLSELVRYANLADNVFAKTLYSIHDKLRSDPELLNAWFTSFNKAVVESYRTLNRIVATEEGDQTELTITSGNKKTAGYILANDWNNVIITRGETEYYNTEWISKYNDLYIQIDAKTDGFKKLDRESAKMVSDLFKLVGIDIKVDALLGEFGKGTVHFKEQILKPLDYLKTPPTTKDKTGYIDKVSLNRSVKFNQFGRLLTLGNATAYYRDDVSNHSELNIKNNLIYDLRNPNFILNFYKKLHSTDSVVIDSLSPYTKVPSNQHSLLLWGDRIVNGKVVAKGYGIFNYYLDGNIKKIDPTTPINKGNRDKLRFFGYSGNKNLSENTTNEYHELNQHDWAYEIFIYYIAKGKYNDQGIKETAIFPLLNPSDRKNTLLFEAPIVHVSDSNYASLVGKDSTYITARETKIFQKIRNVFVDEVIAVDVAKNLLFETDSNGVVIFENGIAKVKDSILNNDLPSQLNYHYKLDEQGNKHYLEFKEENGKLVLDKKRSGNVFGLNSMTVIDQNKQITFNDLPTSDISFIWHLMNSPNVTTTLDSKVNDTETYRDKLDKFVLRFIYQQNKNTTNILGAYKDVVENTYLKSDVSSEDGMSTITKNRNYKAWILEFALNTYLFNIEQTRLFHGNLADYKSNDDLNKRGGQVSANGTSTTLRGIFHGATISDVKLKSKIYRNLADTMYFIKTGEKLSNAAFAKFNKIYEEGENKLKGIDLEIYDTISPYLLNDSANAVSLITMEEFVKRIDGFGLSKQYKNIIDKVTNGTPLDREEMTRFATMQKNFYYDLAYNSDMNKMVPIQIKNAEVVLTPQLIKYLELEDMNEIMIELGIQQLNTTSAEKEGSFHISKIHDDKGKLLDRDTVIKELRKGKREYRYENLHMQQEVNDALYEENITLGRQIMKKMIENIPLDHVYDFNGTKITGEDLIVHYFDLLVENINQDRDSVLREFGVSINEKGELVGEINIDKKIAILEKQAIDLNQTNNLIYGITKGDMGLPKVPLCFGSQSIKIEQFLTSIFTNGINNQTFPGMHAPQMSSLFMNRKDKVKQSDLQNKEGIQWHSKKGLDTKLKSTVTLTDGGIEVHAAEVLLPRWTSIFYDKGQAIDIDNIPDEVRTMIGYRIPTEAKYSIYRFEVVGFLPDNGPAIVLPDDFVTQTGSDFDWDTVYALLYNIHKVKQSDGTYTIETIKYVDNNTELDKKVDAIMEDRKQMVHILSKKLSLPKISELIVNLNSVYEKHAQFIQEHPIGYDLFRKNQQDIRDIEKQLETTTSASERQQLILDKFQMFQFDNIEFIAPTLSETDEYKAIRDEIKKIIPTLTTNEQNTKKARQNRVLDIYSTILKDLIHYPEIIATSNFKDITAVTKKIDELIKNPILNINNFTFEGQQKYRDLSHQGRNLKGISLALDRFNAIANVAHIQLADKLEDDYGHIKINTLPKIKYEVDNSEIEALKKAYGKDIEIESSSNSEKSFVTIVHRFVGNNPAGTFTGVHGKLINSYSAQSTANILDNVAHRLPKNVGEYFIDVWKLLPSIGSTFEISTMLINQPILTELLDFHDRNTNTTSAGREIEEIKRKYQTLLYKLIVANGGPRNESYDKDIAKGKPIYIGGDYDFRTKQYNALGYNNEHIITLFTDDLAKNIHFSNSKAIAEELASATPNKENLKKLEEFARYQLEILETYKIYRTYAKSVTDTGMVLNTDKIGAGPTFDVTSELLYNMNQLHNSKILTIDGESVISKIFPQLAGSIEDSVYPTLQAFFKASNLTSYKMFGKDFTGYTPLYEVIKRRLHNYSDKSKYDKRLSKSITEYLNNALLKDLPWLNNITIEEKETILGIGLEPTTKFDFNAEGALSVFETLSVANQIRVYLDNDSSNSFLTSLSTHLQAKNIEKKGFHKVEYNNIGNLDEHSSSFNDLWYSDNIYERIIARNLVKYDYLANGFRFGLGSFSKLIPSNIWYYGTEAFTDGIDTEKGIGLSAHLYGKLDKLNQLAISHDIDSNKLDEYSIRMFNCNYKERYLRSHSEDNNLVPDAGWWKENVNGETLRVLQMNQHGILSLPANKLQEAATSTRMNRLKSREIIKLKFGDKWQLFQRVDSFVFVDKNDYSGSYYYYPIGMLESFENEEKSLFSNNNVLPNGSEIQSADDYLGIISIMDRENKVNTQIYSKEFNIGNRISSLRAGNINAITVDVKEAEKFATLKEGNYVLINGTDYVKITQSFKNITDTSLVARQRIAEEEDIDITQTHQLIGKTDAFQAKFIYIGNREALIEDAGQEYESENGIEEEISTVSLSKKERVIKANPAGTIVEIDFDINDKDVTVKGEILKIEDALGKDKYGEDINDDIYVDIKNLKTGKIYQFTVYPDGEVSQTLSDKGKLSVGGNTQIYFNTLPTDNNSFKFSSYTSSVSPAINNAITSADSFVKATYGNLVHRAKAHPFSKSTKEVAAELAQLDIKEELTKLDLSDLSSALIHILNYMNVELLTKETGNYKGGILARLVEFENEDIDTLVSDPIKRREFIHQMKYTLQFLQGVVVFDRLESTNDSNLTSDEILVNNQIKALQGLVPTLKDTKAKFDRLLKEFSEANLKRYTTNPEIKDGVRKIMDPGDDESYVQLQLDALADTNNPFIANMVKQYSINMIKADDASIVEIGELEALLRKTYGNITSLTDSDFNRYLEFVEGKRTGRLIQKYDRRKFDADKDKYFKDIKRQYGNNTDDYYTAAKKWFDENEVRVVSEEEIDAVYAQKERDLSGSEFYRWKKANLRVENKKRAVKIGDSGFATPTDKYINPEWLKVKDDPLYQKFVEIINNYSDHFGKATILTRGFIPTAPLEKKRTINPAEIVQRFIESNKIHKESDSFVGENNEMVYLLNVPMVQYFSQETEIKYSQRNKDEEYPEYVLRVLEEVRLSGRGNFNSLAEISAFNKKLRKENDEYHAGQIDYNLGNVFSKFIREANRYKAKSKMKHEFDLALYQIKNAPFYKRDSKGKLVKDTIASNAIGEDVYGYDSGENSRLAQHYSQWLEGIFYGNWDIDEGAWTTISKMLLKFTSSKNMWLNLTAGINNVQFGKLQVRLEAVAGWYFQNSDLNKADAMYLSSIPDIIMNLGSTKASNLTNAIIKRLDVTQNTNERDYTTGMLKQQILSSSTFYLFNDMGEHYMQNVSALAMANHCRIVDGKIVSLADYKFNNYKEALYSILDEQEKEGLDRYLETRFKLEEFKENKKDYLRDYLLTLPIKKGNEFIEKRKEIDKTSEEAFNKNPRLIDAFELNAEGYAILKDEIEIDGNKINTTLNADEFEKFKLKALKVVQKEQGIYNREDAGMAQRRAIGKLMIQFRKYMRPGWNKRFGTKFGKSFWTESRDEWDKGMYVSLWDFLKSGSKRHIDMNESKEVHNMMGKILSDMANFATNVKFYWNTLDDFEKGNIRRVLLEQLYLAATIAVAMMLKGLKPEDDDDENFAYDLTVYEIDRLYSNAMMYNPIGLINEGQKILKSPAAAQGTAIDIYKLISNLVGYPFQTPEERVYQTGVYAKESKIIVNATKLVPILNKYQQLMRINKLNKYYILFRG